MPEFEDISEQYTLSDDVNMQSVFKSTNIEYLEVNNKRLIAIFRGAVLGVAAVDGELTRTAVVELRVYELPPTTGNTEDARSILEDVIDRVATVTETNFEQFTGRS